VIIRENSWIKEIIRDTPNIAYFGLWLRREWLSFFGNPIGVKRTFAGFVGSEIRVCAEVIPLRL
jgi:hypothetical protein